MLLSKLETLLFIGDSITDCDRARPIGEGLLDALGKGYVALVDAMLRSRHPDIPIRVLNMGTNGDTVRDLKKRWDSDVISLKPDWVSIMIGINDVWRQYDLPQIAEMHVKLEEYEMTLRDLLTKTIMLTKGIFLLSPFYIEANLNDDMRKTINEYGNVVKKIASDYGLIYIDVQSAFDDFLIYKYPAEISWDRVHPNLTGHLIIADTIIKTIEQMEP